MMRVVAQAIRMKIIILTRTIEESSGIVAEELQQGRLTVPLMRKRSKLSVGINNKHLQKKSSC